MQKKIAVLFRKTNMINAVAFGKNLINAAVFKKKT